MRLYQTTFIFNKACYMQNATIDALGKTFTIGAGNDDSVIVYHDKESVYVLSENHRLDYIGLERFNRRTGELEFDIFMQSESDDKDWLLNISRYPTKIKYLLEWDM